MPVALERPEQILTADLDADGDVDMLVASARGIAWHANLDGKGSFGAAQTIRAAAKEGAVSMQVGDIDGDDDVDVIASSSDEISWYENDGHGDFSKLHFVANKTDVLDGLFTHDDGSLNLADLDADGDLDMLIADWRKMVWFENTDGRGAYAEGPSLTTEQAHQRVVTSDIDGDGAADVIVAYRDKVVWFGNDDGRGNFSSAKTIAHGNHVDSASLTVADLDGDGDTDIVAFVTEAECDQNGCSARSRLSWFDNRNETEDSFDRKCHTPMMAFCRCRRQMSIPTEIKISFWGGIDRATFTYRGSGMRTETAPLKEGTHISNSPATTLETADIDGDGDADVLSAWNSQDHVSWFANDDGAGDFGDANMVAMSDLKDIGHQVLDMDADGDQDVLIVSSNGFEGNRVSWLENLDGRGNFGSPTTIVDSSSWIHSVKAIDLDADGDIDLLTAAGENGLAWYENVDGLESLRKHQIGQSWSQHCPYIGPRRRWRSRPGCHGTVVRTGYPSATCLVRKRRWKG